MVRVQAQQSAKTQAHVLGNTWGNHASVVACDKSVLVLLTWIDRLAS